MPPTLDRKAARAARKATILAARKALPPRSWLRVRVEPMLTAGLSVEEVARRLATLGDALVAFDRTLPGAIGLALEAIDGEVLYLALLPVVRGIRRGMATRPSAATPPTAAP